MHASMTETRDVVLAIDIGDAKLAAGLMTMMVSSSIAKTSTSISE